jgi:hypothetical protein
LVKRAGHFLVAGAVLIRRVAAAPDRFALKVALCHHRNLRATGAIAADARHRQSEHAMSTTSGEDGGARRALEHLNSVLTANETLEAWAIQRRLFALNHRRRLVAATSGRFLALERGLFGGFTLTDIRWQDLKSVKIDVGIAGARLTLEAFSSPDLASASTRTTTNVYEGLRKDQAEALYRIAQGHDQAWREKRRVRDLEEMRARAGGVQVGTLAGAAPDSTTGDATERLQHAKSMLDAGLISDSEYETLKAKIINQV